MKKINLRNVSDMLSDKMLKRVLGGYVDTSKPTGCKCNDGQWVHSGCTTDTQCKNWYGSSCGTCTN